MFKKIFDRLNPKKSVKNMKQSEAQAKWAQAFDVLRRKWITVPAGNKRIDTRKLLKMKDKALLDKWCEIRTQDTTGNNFQHRGWYHSLYKDVLKDKRVMDVGCGLGIDGITFGQNGTSITLVDIVESNVALVSKISKLFHLENIDFCYMESLNSLSPMGMYDVIWCQGSMHNAPFEVMKIESQKLLNHLKIGGRWIQLAYPKTRWERDGRLPFDRWGEKTDGPHTPWCEWYDLQKLLLLLEPAKFDVILYFEFHNSDFNWFDLIRRQ